MKMMIAVFFGMLACAIARAQESPAKIAADLEVAVKSYQRALEEGAADVDQLLQERGEYAKRGDDLELLKTVETEQESFSADRTLPESVRTTRYQAVVKRLQIKLESSYQDAIKAYLQADLTDDAFATQEELTAFLSEPVKKPNNDWITLFNGNDLSR